MTTMNRDAVRALQAALDEGGFDAGPEDSIMELRTRVAAATRAVGQLTWRLRASEWSAC